VPGNIAGIFSPDQRNDLFFLGFQHCRFVNLSTTQKRVLDLTINIPTTDPNLPVLVLETQSMQFQEYRDSLTDIRIPTDEKLLGRGGSVLKIPIDLPPDQFIEGTVEFDIRDPRARQKLTEHPPQGGLLWLRP